MSEVIYYSGHMAGVKRHEWNEVIDHVFKFQNAQLDTQDEKKGYISFHVDDGWRGGGLSCEEIINEHFKEFCEKHPHIDLRVTAQHVEHLRGLNSSRRNDEGEWYCQLYEPFPEEEELVELIEKLDVDYRNITRDNFKEKMREIKC